jgi:L-iditol 2-dehydrogenase
VTSTLEVTDEFMLAAVKTGPGDENVRVLSVPVPAVAEGLAKIRVVATGICGTDVHVARNEYAHEAPVVMGHEILGEVVEVGSLDDSSWVGQRVACETYFSTCERCDWCRSGRRNLCPYREVARFLRGRRIRAVCGNAFAESARAASDARTP